MKFLLLLLIPLMAWFGRQQGTGKKFKKIPKAVALAGIGVCVAALTGHYWGWTALAIAASVAVGHAVGWGHPLGTVLGGVPNKNYEWWEVGVLRRKPWLALVARGALIGLCAMVVVTVDPRAALNITIAFAVAFPLAPFIVTRLQKLTGDTAWGKQEYWRDGMAGLILWALLWV